VFYAWIGFPCSGAGPELFMVVFLYNVPWYKSTLYVCKMLYVRGVNRVQLMTGWTAKNVGPSCCPQLYWTIRRCVLPTCCTCQTHLVKGAYVNCTSTIAVSSMSSIIALLNPVFFFLYLALSIPHHHQCQQYVCRRWFTIPVCEVIEIFI